MDPISVVVRRGDVVEAVHVVHAAAVRDGALVAEAGDSGLVSYLRSSAKPIQARQLVLAYDDLAEDELAIASASHQAEPAQLDAARKLLARAGAREEDLENGTQAGRPEGKLGHNCSGKHAGMLAVCAANGWPFEGYRLAQHPLQQRILADVASAARVEPEEIDVAVDGCGVPCYALPLERMALVLTATDPRVAAAMRARPELVGGQGADDTDLMRALPGWIAKRGAEGLFCVASPDGLGVALKSADGSSRPLRPAIAAFLRQLDVGLSSFEAVSVTNSRGEAVGELRIGP